MKSVGSWQSIPYQIIGPSCHMPGLPGRRPRLAPSFQMMEKQTL